MAAAVAPSPSGVHPIQRPVKGSRISSFYPVKELPPLSALDSAFQLQEYISLLIRKDVHDVEAIVSIPGKGKGRESSEGEDVKSDERPTAESSSSEEQKDKDSSEGKGDVAVDEACWIYEQLRRLAQDLSHPLITMLQQECTRQTCPEMKAGEWQYLCVAHGNEGAMEQCCAIDYILHTLDSATALINSPRAFPSRLSIPAPSHRHFSSLARRLGRIFAHAYFHHRAAFAQAEAESALYARFLALTSRFDLVPPEFLVIPAGIGFEEHDRDGDEQGPDAYPRLLAASIDPRRDREHARADDPQGYAQHPGMIRLEAGPTMLPGLGGREASPRRMGRNRTDTMVHSEIASVVEELGRAAAGEGYVELGRVQSASERVDVEVERPEDRETKSSEDIRAPEEQAAEPAEDEVVAVVETETEAGAEAASSVESTGGLTEALEDDVSDNSVLPPEADDTSLRSAEAEQEQAEQAPPLPASDVALESAPIVEEHSAEPESAELSATEVVQQAVEDEEEKAEEGKALETDITTEPENSELAREEQATNIQDVAVTAGDAGEETVADHAEAEEEAEAEAEVEAEAEAEEEVETVPEAEPPVESLAPPEGGDVTTAVIDVIKEAIADIEGSLAEESSVEPVPDSEVASEPHHIAEDGEPSAEDASEEPL